MRGGRRGRGPALLLVALLLVGAGGPFPTAGWGFPHLPLTVPGTTTGKVPAPTTAARVASSVRSSVFPEGKITLALNGSPTHAAAPLTTNFSANVSAAGASNFSLTWQFGDGSANQTFPIVASGGSASMRTNHSYPKAGNYTVSVTATDNLNDTRAVGSLLVRVAPAFIVVLTHSPAQAVVGRAVVVTPQVTGGVPPYHAAWTGVPADCFAGNFNLTCVPAAPGNYSVRVTVSDATVDRYSEDVFIVVVPRLFVTASYQSAFTCVASSGVPDYNFTATVSGGAPPVNFTWTIGNGLGVAYGPTVSRTLPLNESFAVTVLAMDSAGENASSTVTFSTSFPACGAVPPPNYAPPRWLLEAGAVVLVGLILVLVYYLWRTGPNRRRPPLRPSSATAPTAFEEGPTAPPTDASKGPPPWTETSSERR